MLVVGLTGGIGSGKTTVSNYFSELGVTIIDTDIIARNLVQPNTPTLHKISQHFGKNILTANGSLNRQYLRQVIFNDVAAKQWLEQLLHPLIRQEVMLQIQQCSAHYCLVVIPLLCETGRQHYNYLDRVLLVDCDEALQKHRTQQRDNCSSELVQQIMASQVSRQQRLAIADDIIINDGDFGQLQQHVLKLHEKYLNL
ncbi:MAG: dephospho-CoA kinase [Gammaproteobacteria bacterium]